MTYSPVPELNALWDFQAVHGSESYAQGFGLYEEFGDREDLAPGWSDADAFHARLKSFARATGGGSMYALWQAEDGSSPVVVFGDEGGIHVVATDVRDLFRILTFDVEPMVDWDGVSFYKDEEYDEPSPSHDEFVAWLETQGLQPIDDADSLVKVAQERYEPSFRAWIDQFPLGEN
ncbi:hypothetical protein LWF15_01430 [Kineosporia rhizophila]|uniref:hypothetical protein n=1 Tax=Kineosporia rhizophila TaxID=84633 RepID=UPI001E47B199|nr:hypothetical protein [Kineosporia rhizophila]MCE0534159.1 hypothetical protein [Kineosporia rhizophila]